MTVSFTYNYYDFKAKMCQYIHLLAIITFSFSAYAGLAIAQETRYEQERKKDPTLPDRSFDVFSIYDIMEEDFCRSCIRLTEDSDAKMSFFVDSNMGLDEYSDYVYEFI